MDVKIDSLTPNALGRSSPRNDPFNTSFQPTYGAQIDGQRPDREFNDLFGRLPNDLFSGMDFADEKPDETAGKSPTAPTTGLMCKPAHLSAPSQSNEPPISTMAFNPDIAGPEAESKTIDYFAKSMNQLIKGNYTDDVTLLGTGAQIGTGLLGLDLPADIRDLYYDLTHWEWSWGHAGQTLLDTAAMLPIIGSLKYVDEAAALAKNGAKNVDEGAGLTKKTLDDTGVIDGPKKTHKTKVKPGGHSEKYGKFKDNADVPPKYSKDKRFDMLSSDPDQGGKISSKTRQEAMAGLEAESQGLLKKPIERGPKGIEFYDGDGIPYDVKAPPSPPENARWPFNAKDSGNSIVKELRKPSYPNKITGELEKRKVILDSTYMNKADHKALWDHIKKNASKEELDRIIEITTDV